MGERSDEVKGELRSDSDAVRSDYVVDETAATADAGTTAVVDEDGEVAAAQIEVEIDRTRSDMSSTIEAIGEKLSPQNVVEQAKETVRDATVGRVERMVDSAGEMVSNAGQSAQQTGTGLLDTIKQNPLPAGMAAAGIAWLLKNRQSGSQGSGRYRSYDQAYRTHGGYGGGYQGEYGGTYQPPQGQAYQGGGYGGPGPGEKLGEAAGQARDTAGNLVSNVQQTTGDVVSGVQQRTSDVVGTATDRAGQVAGSVAEGVSGVAGTVTETARVMPYQLQHTARKAQWQMSRLLNENPLALGVASVAVGAAAGLLLPTTRKEQEVLGQARDSVVEQAESKMREKMDQVEESVQNQ